MVRLAGVKKAEVNFTRGQAHVQFEDGAVTVDQMIEAIQQAGYAARPLAEPR